MGFQFACPNGHLLEAERWQSGRECKCPFCGTTMVIPSVSLEPPVIKTTAAATSKSRGKTFRSARSPLDVAESPFPDESPPAELSILCPNGHTLLTSREMLNKFAMCPECGAKFQLLEKESVEFRQRMEQNYARHQQQLAKNWMNWAVVVVVVVVLGLALLAALL